VELEYEIYTVKSYNLYVIPILFCRVYCNYASQRQTLETMCPPTSQCIYPADHEHELRLHAGFVLIY